MWTPEASMPYSIHIKIDHFLIRIDQPGLARPALARAVLAWSGSIFIEFDYFSKTDGERLIIQMKAAALSQHFTKSLYLFSNIRFLVSCHSNGSGKTPAGFKH